MYNLPLRRCGNPTSMCASFQPFKLVPAHIYIYIYIYIYIFILYPEHPRTLKLKAQKIRRIHDKYLT